MPVILLALLACPKPVAPIEAAVPAETPAPTEAAAADANDPHGSAEGVIDPALAALLTEHWAWQMESAPTWATHLGDHRFDASLGLSGPAGVLAHQTARDAFLARAEALRVADPRDRTTLSLFQTALSDDRAEDVCRFGDWSVSPRDNPLLLINGLPEIQPVRSADDPLEARYRDFGRWVDGEIVGLRAGLADGLTPNAESTQRVITMIRDELARPVAERTHVAELQFDAALSEADRAAATTAIAATAETVVGPALARYADLLEQEVLPVARDDAHAGLSHLPLGAACYGALVRSYTTLDRDADAIHALGLAELERIHAEFRVLGAEVFGSDDLAVIFGHLRDDPALRFETRAQVEAKATEALRRAEAAVPGWFGTLPRTPCEVAPVPDFEAPYTTIAYYQPPAADGSRPGTYYVNSWEPGTRPRHEAEVLAFHESVPGHHLQIALSNELPGLPAFRRHMGMTAFVEGWGLYSERVADEMGLYSGPVDRLGMLSFDAWRASRLVVDTGVHAKGWSRQQAIDFMTANTPLATNNIGNEVDRYLTTPGQALAYKSGQLEILRLRAEAEAELAEAFDIRGFHDAVLGQGAVTLPVLQAQVQAWTAAQAR